MPNKGFYMGSKYARTYKSKYGSRHFVIQKREAEISEQYDGQTITKEQLLKLEQEESYKATKRIEGIPGMHRIDFYTRYITVFVREEKEGDKKDE